MTMPHPAPDPLERYRRKRDQAYEMAGCARMDGDRTDETRWLNEAKEYERLIKEYHDGK
jgi:hypothetical protein